MARGKKGKKKSPVGHGKPHMGYPGKSKKGRAGMGSSTIKNYQ